MKDAEAIAPGGPVSLASFTDCIADELAAVEELFHRELHSDLECVNALVRHVSRFRGKMLRPCLVLLSGKAAGTGELGRPHIVVATVVEMVHMATLVHDDVLDEAELRRKGATINHLRGNEAAVLLGDYLISHSYHLCSSFDEQYASRLIGRTTNRVCEGELLQVHNRDNRDLDEATYLDIITRKTASLCAACCLLGARLAGAPDRRARQLEQYGLALGTAFQIQDDILDLVGQPQAVGKSLGIDLRKGKMTLPLIHFLRTSSGLERRRLLKLLDAEAADPGPIAQMLRAHGSIQYARDRAGQLVAGARRALRDLPEGEAREVLDGMAQFVIARGG